MLKIDFAVLDFIQSHLRTGVGDYLMPLISRLGDKGFIWIAAALFLVLFPRTRRLGVAVAAALAIEILLCRGLIKPLAARIRPCDINTGIQMLVARPTDYSFPSGHTAASFAAASALYFRRSRWWLPAGLLAALLLAGVIVLGALATFGVSRLLSATLLRGVPSAFTLEVPPFRRPRVGQVIVRSVVDRTLRVLGRAALIAAPAGLVIWLLANVPAPGGTLLSACVSALDPVGRFLGMDGALLMAFLLALPANELTLPLALLAYTSGGTLLRMEDAQALGALLRANGWTWLTALNAILFSLFHWPCSTTLLTIARETRSAKWTLVGALLPTLVGAGVCALTAAIARGLGLAA